MTGVHDNFTRVTEQRSRTLAVALTVWWADYQAGRVIAGDTSYLPAEHDAQTAWTAELANIVGDIQTVFPTPSVFAALTGLSVSKAEKWRRRLLQEARDRGTPLHDERRNNLARRQLMEDAVALLRRNMSDDPSDSAPVPDGSWHAALTWWSSQNRLRLNQSVDKYMAHQLGETAWLLQSRAHGTRIVQWREHFVVVSDQIDLMSWCIEHSPRNGTTDGMTAVSRDQTAQSGWLAVATARPLLGGWRVVEYTPVLRHRYSDDAKRAIMRLAIVVS